MPGHFTTFAAMATPDTSDKQFQKIVSHAKEYGFVFPSSEIYDGLAAVYDYGPNGAELRSNLRQYWWRSMVQLHENIVGLDAAIFMHPKTWKASGHTDAFNDPLIDNKDSKKRYRADVLLEEQIEKFRQKADKEVAKGQKRFKEAFDEAEFRRTNPRVLKYEEQAQQAEQRMKQALEAEDLVALKQLIEDLEITCPVSGSRNWTEVRQFNLMFSTEVGSVAGSADKIYLRPETAQGIFVNFLNVINSMRMKVPFGIAQMGKAFRNEIVARQFIFRMREFEQMEMQFFVRPGEQKQWYEHWKSYRMRWHKAMGTAEDSLRFHDHIKTAHYADAAVDIEYAFPFGIKELEGIHSRTDFDLKSHQEHSGKKLQYFDPELNKNYVPYVVETSIGLDRLFLATLCNAFTETTDEKGKERTFLKLHPALAPIKAAVFPLTKKDGLPDKAREVMAQLQLEHPVSYEEKDSIGRRYTRQDLVGTPFCFTVDHQSLEDNTVTVRERDSMEQYRLPIEGLSAWLNERVSMAKLLGELV